MLQQSSFHPPKYLQLLALTIIVNFLISLSVIISTSRPPSLPPNNSNEDGYNVPTQKTLRTDECSGDQKLAKVPKVLIVSQARSGSSFLGSIMSASSNSFYYFEPFEGMTINKKDFQDDYTDKYNEAASFIAEVILKNLFECRLTKTEENKHQKKTDQANCIGILCGKHLTDCNSTSARFVKVIRLRYFTLKPWIENSYIKVCAFSYKHELYFHEHFR